MDSVAGSGDGKARRTRSKRSRKPPAHNDPVAAGKDESDDGAGEEIEQSETESEGSPETRTARSSARHASAIVAKFCDGKKQAVGEIGFGGCLYIPRINRLNLKYCVWILTRVDVSSRSIQVGRDSIVELRPDIMGKMVGVPCSGMPVCGLEPDTNEEKNDFVRHVMGARRQCANHLKAAELVVQKPWGDDVTPAMVEEFQVAFVIWIVGRFFAPTGKHGHGSTEFWGALYTPKEIKDYNWGAYFLDHMIEAATRVQADIRNNKMTISITGCPLLAQVFYLDNIDLGPLSRPHTTLPRILDYDDETTINKMIQADTTGENFYGACEALRSDQSCYMSGEAGMASSSKQQASYTGGGNVFGAREALQRHQLGPMSGMRGTASSSKLELHRDQSNRPRFQAGSATPRTPMQLGRTALPSLSNELSEFMKRNYPGLLGTDVVDALKYHNARCIMHAHTLKASIIKENIKLARKILGADMHQQSYGKKAKRAAEDFLSGGESETEAPQRKPRGTGMTKPGNDRPATHVRTRGDGGVSPPCHEPHQLEEPVEGRANYSTMPRGADETTTARAAPAKAQHRAGNPLLDDCPSFDLGIGTPVKNGLQNGGTGEHTPTLAPSLDHDGRKDLSAKGSAIPTPHSPLTETMIYSECAIALRWNLSPGSLLCGRSLEKEYSDSPITKRAVKPGNFAKSPWAIGFSHPTRDMDITHSLMDWLSSTTSSELASTWLSHDHPRQVRITGTTLKPVITGCRPMEYDMFDIIIRRMRQLDHQMYPAGLRNIRWRHIFESDFSMHVMGNANPSDNVAVRAQFTGPSVLYEIQRCRQIILPLLAARSWCAYSWDMKRRRATIIDPTAAARAPEDTLLAHRPMVQRLQAALASCIELFFEGWSPQWEGWDIAVLNNQNLTADPQNSGIYTLFSIMNFNGDSLSVDPTPEALDIFREKILYEVLSLEGNKGNLPTIFVHTIDDH